MRCISDDEFKTVLVEIMKDFHEFCLENNITYYAGYGTLLGAIRHKGFIPWDDDLDVIVPRSDYNKLIQMFNKRESKFRIKDFNFDPKYPYNFAKVYDSRTKLVENLYHDYDIGIYIDVFPLDFWPDDSRLLSKIQKCQKISKIKSYKIGMVQGWKKNIALLLMKPLFMLVPLKRIIQHIEDLVEKSESDKEYTGNICANVYGSKEKMKTEWFKEKKIVGFESIQICIPRYYNEILTQLYGDYMTPPPVEKRVTHHNNYAYFK